MANERVSPFHCPGPEMCNKNLLDNWYFLQPVNQKGQNAYTHSYTYGFDRWKTTGTLTIASDGIAFNASARIEGPINGSESLSGKTLTFSLLDTENLYAATFNVDLPVSGNKYILTGKYNCYINGNFVGIYNASGAETTVIAAKLELGPTQTLAHLDSTGKWVLNEIPNYVEELNKCRYYYRVFDTEAQRTANNWGMRLANPTAGTIRIDGATKYTLDANL